MPAAPKLKKLMDFDPLMEHDVVNEIQAVASVRKDQPLGLEFVLSEFLDLDDLRDTVYDAISDYIHGKIIDAYDYVDAQTGRFYE